MSDIGTLDGLQESIKRHEQRLREKPVLRATLEPILQAIDAAESALAGLSVFDVEGRYRLARARVEILRVLRAPDQVGKSVGERNAAAAAAFIVGGLRQTAQ